MTKNKEKPHSKEMFTGSRNFWWNEDYLELFVKRWKLRNVKSLLEVGCGHGYWLDSLLPLFKKQHQSKWCRQRKRIYFYFKTKI